MRLMNELAEYADNATLQIRGLRASVLYDKCIRHGHRDLAGRIKVKYGHLFPNARANDLYTAFALALSASRSQPTR